MLTDFLITICLASLACLSHNDDNSWGSGVLSGSGIFAAKSVSSV